MEIIIIALLFFIAAIYSFSQYHHTIIPGDTDLELPHKLPPKPNQYCSAEVKAKYMKGFKWRVLKNICLRRANHCCEHCGSKHRLALHHETYVRLLNERTSDLRILCYTCHNKLHEYLGYSRKSIYPIELLKDLP